MQRGLLAPLTLQSLADTMGTLQLVFIVASGLAGTVGLALHFGQDEYDKIMDNVEGLIEPVCDATEILASVPITSPRLHGPFTFMCRAADSASEGFLGLSKPEKLRLEDTFRAGVLMQSTELPDIEQPQVTINNLLDLTYSRVSRAHRNDLVYWLANVDVDSIEGAQSIYDGERGVSEPISRAAKIVDSQFAQDIPNLEVWAQLAAMAMADAEILPESHCAAIWNDSLVSEQVLNAYQAAKIELRNKRSNSHYGP